MLSYCAAGRGGSGGRMRVGAAHASRSQTGCGHAAAPPARPIVQRRGVQDAPGRELRAMSSSRRGWRELWRRNYPPPEASGRAAAPRRSLRSVRRVGPLPPARGRQRLAAGAPRGRAHLLGLCGRRGSSRAGVGGGEAHAQQGGRAEECDGPQGPPRGHLVVAPGRCAVALEGAACCVGSEGERWRGLGAGPRAIHGGRRAPTLDGVP